MRKPTPSHFAPDPAVGVRLFGLTTAGLGEDSLPRDITLVVGVDGSVDVKGVLQNLPSAGVDHRPLLFCVSNSLRDQRGRADTYDSGSPGRHPRDEHDLASTGGKVVSQAHSNGGQLVNIYLMPSPPPRSYSTS